jgi:hypothetical protein
MCSPHAGQVLEEILYLESQVFLLIPCLDIGGDEDAVMMKWSDKTWLNGLYFAHTDFLFSECHFYCHLSPTRIYSVFGIMGLGELLSSRLLTVDLMLIQELYRSHNSDI